jgi:phosphotransferase system HPr (HPr) family protein
VVDGKSIIGIATLHAEKNSTILIRASGEDASQAIEALTRLITNNFEEI